MVNKFLKQQFHTSFRSDLRLGPNKWSKTSAIISCQKKNNPKQLICQKTKQESVTFF